MNIGIIRRADSLGRIVIPKELRDFFLLGRNEPVEIIATEQGILIRKPEYQVTKVEKENENESSKYDF